MFVALILGLIAVAIALVPSLSFRQRLTQQAWRTERAMRWMATAREDFDPSLLRDRLHSLVPGVFRAWRDGDWASLRADIIPPILASFQKSDCAALPARIEVGEIRFLYLHCASVSKQAVVVAEISLLWDNTPMQVLWTLSLSGGRWVLCNVEDITHRACYLDRAPMLEERLPAVA